MKHYEENVSSKAVFEGRVFTITVDEARLQNGKIATREVVHHNGGAAVVAIDANKNVALVRQFRYAIGRETLELPAGKIEPNEDPKLAAYRELGEEAGLEASHFTDFGKIVPTCAYDTEVIYLYLATGLRPVPTNLDEDEFVSVAWMPFEEAVGLVMDGTIVDAKTVSGLLRAKLLLDADALGQPL